MDEWLDMRLNRGSEKTQLNSASLQLFTNAYAFKKAAGYGSRTAGYVRLFCCLLEEAVLELHSDMRFRGKRLVTGTSKTIQA